MILLELVEEGKGTTTYINPAQIELMTRCLIRMNSGLQFDVAEWVVPAIVALLRGKVSQDNPVLVVPVPSPR